MAKRISVVDRSTRPPNAPSAAHYVQTFSSRCSIPGETLVDGAVPDSACRCSWRVRSVRHTTMALLSLSTITCPDRWVLSQFRHRTHRRQMHCQFRKPSIQRRVLLDSSPCRRQIHELSAFRLVAGRLLHDRQPVQPAGTAFPEQRRARSPRLRLLVAIPLRSTSILTLRFSDGWRGRRIAACGREPGWPARLPPARVKSSFSRRPHSAMAQDAFACSSSSVFATPARHRCELPPWPLRPSIRPRP